MPWTERVCASMRLTWAPLVTAYPEEMELMAIFVECIQESIFPCIHHVLRPLLLQEVPYWRLTSAASSLFDAERHATRLLLIFLFSMLCRFVSALRSSVSMRRIANYCTSGTLAISGAISHFCCAPLTVSLLMRLGPRRLLARAPLALS